MTYQLLATDLDGTLLNDQKQISKENIATINRALDLGKEVVISSGRCIDECRDIFQALPKLRYAICESGACIYDVKNDHLIHSKSIDPNTVKEMLDYAHNKEIMIQIMSKGHTFVSKDDLTDISDFRISQYLEHFFSVGTIVEDAYEHCRKEGWNAGKICLYHKDADDREITRKHFESLPVTLANAEETSLEISPVGIDKGIGLQKLCEHLDIPIEQTIAVGDSYNDLQILKDCGLSVAVANAREVVKDICNVIVADNNHDGVKEAVETYLLGETERL